MTTQKTGVKQTTHVIPKAALSKCCFGQSLNKWPTARQTGAYPIELTGRS